MRCSHARRLVGLVVLGVTLSPAVVFAERENDAHAHLDKRLAMLTKKLSLTDDQAQKVRAILESSQQSAQQAAEANRLAMQQRKEQTDQQILGVLNDQQKAQYAKMQEERKKKWEERKGKGTGFGWFRRHKEEA